MSMPVVEEPHAWAGSSLTTPLSAVAKEFALEYSVWHLPDAAFLILVVPWIFGVRFLFSKYLLKNRLHENTELAEPFVPDAIHADTAQDQHGTDNNDHTQNYNALTESDIRILQDNRAGENSTNGSDGHARESAVDYQWKQPDRNFFKPPPPALETAGTKRTQGNGMAVQQREPAAAQMTKPPPSYDANMKKPFLNVMEADEDNVQEQLDQAAMEARPSSRIQGSNTGFRREHSMKPPTDGTRARTNSAEQGRIGQILELDNSSTDDQPPGVEIEQDQEDSSDHELAEGRKEGFSNEQGNVGRCGKRKGHDSAAASPTKRRQRVPYGLAFCRAELSKKKPTPEASVLVPALRPSKKPRRKFQLGVNS